jgi:hypothetical protein
MFNILSIKSPQGNPRPALECDKTARRADQEHWIQTVSIYRCVGSNFGGTTRLDPLLVGGIARKWK